MNINEHRKAVVRAIIDGCNKVRMDEQHNLAFLSINEMAQHSQMDMCVATGLTFVEKMSEMQITISEYGPLFIGLWLDCRVRLDQRGHGNTIFPRWLAEVLNEKCSLGIEESDIYEEYKLND
jgi:hypothetical protein